MAGNLISRQGSHPVSCRTGRSVCRYAHPYAWLLDRVGDEGIRLTGAGYLPPAHVETASAELGLLEDILGTTGRGHRTQRERLSPALP
jgi:hypothetical protein